MSLRFEEYANDTYEDAETVDRLVDEYGWDREVAEQYAEHFKPMYEVTGVFEYDPSAMTLKVIEAEVNGVRMVPA